MSYKPLFLLVFVVVLAVSGRAQPETVTAQARRLLNAGQADAAINLLSAALSQQPGDTGHKFLLGQAYYQKNDYANAVATLTPLARPANPEPDYYRQAVQMLAMSHYFQGRLAESIPYFELLTRWSPDNAQLDYALGVCYTQTRQNDKAREVFARLYQLDPKSAAAYLLNARMLLRQRIEDTAEQELNKAIQLDPKLPQARFLLGEIAVYRADLERGVSLFQQEIAVNPAFDQPYYRLGETYTRQQKWDEAINPLQKAIWLNPYFSGPYIVLGKVYLKKADLGNAENMLRRAVQMDPNNYSAHHLLAQTLQQAGRAEEAKQEFATAERLRTAAEKQP
jgi:tetratricopeptide (TPR) repeat protein